MSLSNLHTSGWLKGSYTADMAFLLKEGENNSLRLYGLGDPNGSAKGITPYFDGSIAIGYGFDLLTNSIASIRYFLSTAGITLSQQADDDERARLDLGEWDHFEPPAQHGWECQTLLNNT